MTSTYAAVYVTDATTYTAYVDARDERKARNFFEGWLHRLESPDFSIKLESVSEMGASLSRGSIPSRSGQA